jgi:hypothetical protein
MDVSFFAACPRTGSFSVPRTSGHMRNADLISIHPEIDDFRMEQSAISGQRSAKNLVIMRFLLKAESKTLIALIRK